MRSRALGTTRAGVPQVVMVQGMGVSDYLIPAIGALGRWTRAHLVELPGLSGSGDPPRELSVAEYGQCVADWVQAHWSASGHSGGLVLGGHSSGTQVAASAAIGLPMVTGVVLASPTVDPAARGWLPLIVRWLRDGRREPPGLVRLSVPEWRRAGVRRLAHMVRAVLADGLEESIAGLFPPLLVIRGRDDLIGTGPWCRKLALLARDGTYVEVAGAHTFPWRDPDVWSAPIRQFATRVRPGGADRAKVEGGL